jgi:hypothetical protein
MSDWTEAQLEAWLHEIKLGHLHSLLQGNCVTAKSLPLLQMGDLVACGIAVGPARQLLAQIYRYNKKGGAAKDVNQANAALTQAIAALSNVQALNQQGRANTELLQAISTSLVALETVAKAHGLVV